MLPLINIELHGSVYPVVSLRGKYSTIKLNFGPSFAFNHEEFLEFSNPLEETVVNQKLLQEFKENSKFLEKCSKLNSSILEIDSNAKKLNKLLDIENRFKKSFHKLNIHRPKSSLFSTKISNSEENKSDLCLNGGCSDVQNTDKTDKTRFQRFKAGIDKQKLDLFKNCNESETCEDNTNANTHNDLRQFDTTGGGMNVGLKESTCRPTPPSHTLERIGKAADEAPTPITFNTLQQNRNKKKCGCSNNNKCIIF